MPSREERIIGLKKTQSEQQRETKLLKAFEQTSEKVGLLNLNFANETLTSEKLEGSLGFTKDSGELQNRSLDIKQSFEDVNSEGRSSKLEKNRESRFNQFDLQGKELGNRGRSNELERGGFLNKNQEALDGVGLRRENNLEQQGFLEKRTDLSIRGLKSSIRGLFRQKALTREQASLQTRSSFITSGSIQNALNESRFKSSLQINSQLREKKFEENVGSSLLEIGQDLKGESQLAQFKFNGLLDQLSKQIFTRELIRVNELQKLNSANTQIRSAKIAIDQAKVGLEQGIANLTTQFDILGLSEKSLTKQREIGKGLFDVKRDSLTDKEEALARTLDIETRFFDISATLLTATDLLTSDNIENTRGRVDLQTSQKLFETGKSLEQSRNRVKYYEAQLNKQSARLDDLSREIANA